MAQDRKAGASGPARWRRAVLGLPGRAGVFLLIIWGLIPLIPQDSGLRFGLGYQLFFTGGVAFTVIFFWFLGLERVPLPRSTLGAVASVILVFGLAVGGLVAIGVAYPQFPLPEPPRESISADAIERGKELFWGSELGCFRCHAIAGQGGTRAPDLKGIVQRGEARAPGLRAEEYIQEKVLAGLSYKYTVPDYAPIMPPYRDRLTAEQLKDIIAYLLAQ